MRVVVLADTHLHVGSKRGLPAPLLDVARVSDCILHAGDITDDTVLDALRTCAPVEAVLGNNDVGVDLPETCELVLGGVRVAMIHDSGARAGRAARMRRRFPTADVVVFGHSHIPWNEPGVDGQLLFNPGSPTQRRRQPYPTFGFLELAAGEIARHDIVRLGP